MKITDIRFGMLRVPLKTPFKTALRTRRHGRRHRRHHPHRHRPRRLRRGAGDRGHHRRHARLDRRGDPQVHRAAPDRRGDRQSQPDHAADPERAREELQRQGGGRDRALRSVRPALRRAALQDAGRRRSGRSPPISRSASTTSTRWSPIRIAAVERGFESLKIKVGKDIGVDIERVKAIHAAVEGRALLRLDANQGWAAKQAVYALQTLEDAGVQARAGRAAGQGAGPRGHEVRHRARAHADHGGRERVRARPR